MGLLVLGRVVVLLRDRVVVLLVREVVLVVPRVVERVRVTRTGVGRVEVPRVAVVLVGVVVVVSEPRGLLGRWALAEAVNSVTMRTSREVSKVDFFIVIAFVMTASTVQEGPATNFLSTFNLVLGFTV